MTLWRYTKKISIQNEWGTKNIQDILIIKFLWKNKDELNKMRLNKIK